MGLLLTGHTQLGIFNLVEAGFTIYHATNMTDIFTMEDRRLQAGLEYTAKYNLGYDVPYTPNCGPPGLVTMHAYACTPVHQ